MKRKNSSVSSLQLTKDFQSWNLFIIDFGIYRTNKKNGKRLSRRCRTTIAVNVAIGLSWTAVIIGAAVLGAVGPIAAVILHNVGTIAVIINSGRLLAYDENA